MSDWRELHLRTAEPEALAEILEACGALAVTLRDAADNPVLEPAPGQTPLWQHTRLTGLFPGDVNTDDVETALRLGGEAFILSLQWGDLAEQVWERTWLEHFRPIAFGDWLRVAPHGVDVPDDNRRTLRLDPGLAFGTGTHPSTALCLDWLGCQDLHGHTVLDYGCGSGILAIASVMAGATEVVACDIDPQAETATANNAQANQLNLRLMSCEQAAERRYDLVIANILAGILVDLAPTLQRCMTPGGGLLLAGLLSDQADMVESAFPRLQFRRHSQAQWCALLGTVKDCD